jgi:hypothetical protein
MIYEKRGFKMSKTSLGFGFIFISALLFAIKYLSAAIFYQGAADGIANYENALNHVSSLPLNLSMIALIIGIVFIALGLKEQKKAKNQ